jgi:hypothetical protein
MWPFKLFLQARSRASAPLLAAVACAAALGAAFACSRPLDVHESDEAKGKPCISCHSGAYTAAATHVVGHNVQTCQDCHATTGWVPATSKDHPWPIQNKHVGVTCVACHTKGFAVGDTPKDCLGCHRKDYEASQSPKHVVNGADQYPLDCLMCHADTGFKPSPWKHAWPLVGRHFIAPCAGCHSGTPPTYKGTTTDCYQCHKNDADNVAPGKNPLHTSFPHVCLNCHLMSGWTQGPPLAGLHPESSFPIAAGVHSSAAGDGGQVPIVCLDCHKLEKGLAAGGANTDCLNCHVGGADHHVSPAIDARHQKTPDGGTVAGYPQGASATNFCLTCHSRGQHL